jgi:hypothetical protein
MSADLGAPPAGRVLNVVVFRWKPGVTARQLDRFVAGLSALLAANPDVQGFRLGVDRGAEATNYHFALVVAFADFPAFDRYLRDPEHLAFVEREVVPLVEHSAAVQFGPDGDR